MRAKGFTAHGRVLFPRRFLTWSRLTTGATGSLFVGALLC